MAHVMIRLSSGGDEYSVEVERLETNALEFDTSVSHLDALLDKAVTRMKRAYTPTPNEGDKR